MKLNPDLTPMRICRRYLGMSRIPFGQTTGRTQRMPCGVLIKQRLVTIIDFFSLARVSRLFVNFLDTRNPMGMTKATQIKEFHDIL